MQYLDGPTLDAFIDEKYTFTQSDYDREMGLLFLSITMQLIIAQEEFGLINRDVKPRNIIIHNGLPVVVDWGIAYHMGDDFTVTEYNVNVGSDGYAPFEQYKTESPDDIVIPKPANDIFSLGVTLYQAFGNISQQNLRLISPDYMSEFVKSNQYLKSLHPKLQEVIARATMDYAEDRYSSMREVYAALTECFADFLSPEELANPDGYLPQLFDTRITTISDM